MQLDSQQRTSPTPRPESRVFAIATVIAFIVAGLALVAIPELRDPATRLGRSAASLVGVAAPVGDFTEVYTRLGIAPLPASLAASDKIAANLAILAREPCDGKAIAALGEALVKQRAERSAAEALLGFAQACPNGDGARYRAAQILRTLGDNAKVVTILDELIATEPQHQETVERARRLINVVGLAVLSPLECEAAAAKSALRTERQPRHAAVPDASRHQVAPARDRERRERVTRMHVAPVPVVGAAAHRVQHLAP